MRSSPRRLTRNRELNSGQASKTPLFTGPQPLGARNARSSPLGAARALEIPRAHSKPQGRRHGCSSQPRSCRGARNWLLEPSTEPQERSNFAARAGAQACSASLEHSNWPLEPARFRWGARSVRYRCSSSLGCRNVRKNNLKTLCSGRKSQRTPASVHLCFVHGFARVHPNIYIYIYIYEAASLTMIFRNRQKESYK